MRKPWIFFLIVAIGVALYLFRENKSPVHDEAAPISVPDEAQPAGDSLTPSIETAPERPADNSKISATPEPYASKPRLNQVIPTLEEIRNEVTEDPHNTPKSLIGFSIDIGERMRSVKNESEATDLFREFEDCLFHKSNSSAQSIQALCLLNARRLSDQYKDLKNSYVALATRADRRVLEMSQQVQ
jgi:hypothetical protein